MRRRGAFVIKEELSRGEWGNLYEVYSQQEPDRPLLLKELHTPPTAEWRKSVSSIPLNSRLRTPLEVTQDDDGAYLVLPYLPGPNLETSRLERYDGRVPVRKALAWLRDTLQGLLILHDLKLIHGDVKPSNLVLDSDGQAVLVDLGALQRSDSGEPVLATPEYLVPKKSLQSTPQRDLYAAALTFGALVTGEILPPEKARLSQSDPLIPESCDEILLRGLGVEEPYRSTRQMLATVERLLGEQTGPRTTSPPTRLVNVPESRKTWLLWPFVAALLCYPIGMAAAHFLKEAPPGARITVFERTGTDIQEGSYEGQAIWKTTVLGRPVAAFAGPDAAEGNETARARAHWLAAVISEAYLQRRTLQFEFRRELEDNCEVWLVGSDHPDKFAFRVTSAESELFDTKAPVLARLWSRLIQDTMTLVGGKGSPGNSAGVLALRPWKTRAETLAGGRNLSEAESVKTLAEAFASLKPDLKEDILDSYLPEKDEK